MANRLTIVGLGPGSFEALTLEAYNALTSADRLFLRTNKHPSVERLSELGINYSSFDHFYETGEQFDQVYQRIADQVIAACSTSDVVYAVPGHPWVGEATVGLLVRLAEEKGIAVRFTSSVSFLDDLFTALQIDPCGGIKIIDALSIESNRPSTDTGNLIMQVYNRLLAGEVKLQLMEIYPDEFPLWVIRAAGVRGEERKEQIPLYELDRLDWIDYLTSVYIPPYSESRCRYPLDSLVEVMEKLRGENGCPWDKEQTHLSLIPYVLEEAYEVIDAIEEGDPEQLADELGDLLLQIVFHAQLARESDLFDLNDVVEKIVAKMIRRHPHVFGEVQVENTDQVLKNWNAIKELEKKEKAGEVSSCLQDLPRGMPALMRAYKVQGKAAQVGFDWEQIGPVWDKVEEELGELRLACQSGVREEVIDELGDLLFAVVNLSRFLDVQPELALGGTIKKFMDRFRYIECKAKDLGKTVQEMSLAELDCLWEEAKNLKKNNEKAGNFLF